MDSKLIIFLACVTLAQGTYVPQLLVSYGLSDAEVAVVNKIMTNQEAAVTAFKQGVNSLFNVLDWLETGAYDRCSPFINAFDSFKASANLTLDSIPLVFARASVETARSNIYSYLDDASTQLMYLFVAGQYAGSYDSSAEMEERMSAIQTDFQNVLEAIFDSIYDNQGTTDAEVLPVMAKAKEESALGLSHILNALFNKIKLYASEVRAGCTDKAFAPYSREFRAKAVAGIDYGIEYTFSLLKTLYINNELNQSGIVSVLFDLLHVYAVQFRGFKEGNEVLFGAVDGYSRIYNLSLYDDGDTDYSLIDADYNTVVAKFDVGDGSFLDFCAILHPDSAERIVEVKAEKHQINIEASTSFFDVLAMATAVDGVYDEIIAEIEADKDAVSTSQAVPEFTDIFYNAIRDNKTYSEETENTLALLQNYTIDGARLSMNNFYSSVGNLTENRFAGVVTDDDFTANAVLLDETLYALDLFCQTMSYAAFAVLREQAAAETEA